MIRLLLDPPRFECDEPIGRHALAELIADACRAQHMKVLIRVCKLPNPSREIRNEGIEKSCKKCGAKFRVRDRSDCRALCCRDCRDAVPKRAPRPSERMALLPFDAPPKAAPVCKACGERLPEIGHAGELCLECAPLGARLSA